MCKLPQAIPAAAVIAGVAAACPISALAQEQGPVWTATEIQRVGPPEAEFGAVTDAALDAVGRLWIVDGMSGELHVHEGGNLRRVASAGPGPGELTAGAVEVVILAGDTVLVVEPHTRRLHRFGPDGEHIATGVIAGDDMTGGWRALPDGRLAARIYPRTVMLPDAEPAEGGDPVRAFERNGAPGEVLAVLPPMESFRMGAGPMPIITLLAPQPLWDVDEQGRVLVASTHAYEVRAEVAGRTEVTLVSKTVVGGRISADLEAAARELLRETLNERRTPPPVAEQMIAGASVAATAPVIGGIMAGPGGTIWVREAARRGEDLVDLQQPGGRTWRIHFAPSRATGTIMLPAGFQPLEWSGDRLVGIARDALGRTSAVVLRVREPA